MRSFVERLTLQLATAETARQAGDSETLARFAHWLAGSAGTVGYDAFTEPARRLERCVGEGDIAGIAATLAQLHAMTGRVVVPEPQDVAVPA